MYGLVGAMVVGIDGTVAVNVTVNFYLSSPFTLSIKFR